jgi:Tfp pilus assembly protein PilZ
VESRPEAGSEPRFLGYLSSISETGAFIQCTRPRAVGASLIVRLHLGRSEREVVELEVQVIWTRSYAGRNRPSAGMGVQFKSFGASARDVIRDFCAGTDPDPNPRI